MGIRKSKRLFGAVLVAGLIGSASYAMTASNTFAIATNQAGEGSQTITGFAVSNVSYTLGLDPESYSAVSFDLNGEASDVRAKVTSAGTEYVTCTNPDANSWTCEITNTVASANELTVIAVQ